MCDALDNYKRLVYEGKCPETNIMKQKITIELKTKATSPKKQINSKDRVKEHAEVFTNIDEINSMLKMIVNETERIDSRFLEPACGDGNFLAEILRIKLRVVKNVYGSEIISYSKYSLLAVSSIYGIELLEDNTDKCRDRLLDIWLKAFVLDMKSTPTDNLVSSIKYILKLNIVNGDALTFKTRTGRPIHFSEWSFITSNKVQRSEYTFKNLVQPALNQKAILQNSIEYQDFDTRGTRKIVTSDKSKFIKKTISKYDLVYKNGK